jgi:hypothetical protein
LTKKGWILEYFQFLLKMPFWIKGMVTSEAIQRFIWWFYIDLVELPSEASQEGLRDPSGVYVGLVKLFEEVYLECITERSELGGYEGIPPIMKYNTLQLGIWDIFQCLYRASWIFPRSVSRLWIRPYKLLLKPHNIRRSAVVF